MEDLLPGDVLLTERQHTEMYIGNGKNVGDHYNYDGKHGDSRTRVSVFQAESLFKRIQVLGVEDRRKSRTVDGSLRSHGVTGNILCIRHLLDKYQQMKTHGVTSIVS